MNTPLLRVMPGAVILHHRGQLLLGLLSGSMASTTITEADLALLARFLRPQDPRAIMQQLAGMAPPAAREALARRLAGWHQRGILVNASQADADSSADSSPASPVRVDDCQHVGAVPPGLALRLGRNFLVQIDADGFLVQRGDGKSLLLDHELVTLLVGFFDGRQPERHFLHGRPGTDPTRLRRAAGWLVEQKLLFPITDETSARRVQLSEVPRQQAVGKRWCDIEADGRIPIYFTPHMENHFPLALGMIFSAIRAFRGGALLERYLPVPITYLEPAAFLEGPYRKFGRGIWLFSNYMWSDQLNLEVSRRVKQDDPGNICIHGGPSTPNYEQACRDWMARHDSVDIAVHGEGEVTTTQVLAAIERDEKGDLVFDKALAEVEGITYRPPGSKELMRTPPRLRMAQPDVVPSPYAEGVFDVYEGRVEAAIVETNRGCPFKCTFCDWGSATNQKITKFELDRVYAEIEWIGRRRVGVLWIADANFGMLKRDLEIAERIVAVKRQFGYPREVVVNYTKNANERLAEIIKVFSDGGIISQGIISIQTSDEQTLEIIDRKNIKTEKYDELIDVFSNLGLPLSTDLMIGLPGITPAAFDRDLQRYIDADVAVKAYPTQLLPNSPMAHPAYIEKYRIRADDEGYLVSCSSYSAEELQQMKWIYHVHTAADGYSALRYVMRFLQWEHDIPAMRLLHDLADQVQTEPDRYPAMTWVLRFFNTEKCMPGGWRRFYDEIAQFLAARYGLQRDSALDTVLTVNELVMPDEARDYPLGRELRHDFVSYFRTHNRLGVTDIKALSSYGPGRFTVSDPNNIRLTDIEHQQYDNHQYFWELNSAVCRPQSIADAGIDSGNDTAEVGQRAAG
ncbi:MAG: radical SAM protein [Wenzhouxiangella sp.]|nr:MAG: radical SAM protein [Wenzhouxiangella sp.]